MVSGCSTANSGSNGSSGNDGGKVKVVATTDVYADIVKQVGGDNVDVTPIIASTSTDPHSYEATAADRVKTKDAATTSSLKIWQAKTIAHRRLSTPSS